LTAIHSTYIIAILRSYRIMSILEYGLPESLDDPTEPSVLGVFQVVPGTYSYSSLLILESARHVSLRQHLKYLIREMETHSINTTSDKHQIIQKQSMHATPSSLGTEVGPVVNTLPFIGRE
jgi:hypothetical protein